MNNRRDFFKTAAAAVLGAVNVSAAESLTQAPALTRTGPDDRKYWVSVMEKLASPVLGHLAKRELRKVMPVETSGSAADRSQYTHLEAFGTSARRPVAVAGGAGAGWRGNRIAEKIH